MDKNKRSLDSNDELDGASTSKNPRLDKHAYNRCRKFFSSSDKCSAKNLRPPSQVQIEKYNARFSVVPPLSAYDKLCYKCRTQINDLCQTPVSSQSKLK